MGVNFTWSPKASRILNREYARLAAIRSETARLLQRILPDIERALGTPNMTADYDFDSDPAAPASRVG